LIKKAQELIDMRNHKGEHPRFGATDVCPLVPISGISMEETAAFASTLAERVGKELAIPCTVTSRSQRGETQEPGQQPQRRIRRPSQEIEGPRMETRFRSGGVHRKCGQERCHAIGARNFLVAYNVNLNSTSTRRANAIAFDIREAGRVLRDGDPLTGKPLLDANGEPKKAPGKLKAVKGIGWFIEEYGIAQLSLNLTDIT
jgi:glutamate formiminotransferase/formiminotetrahydrofolate cyclodeaminase